MKNDRSANVILLVKIVKGIYVLGLLLWFNDFRSWYGHLTLDVYGLYIQSSVVAIPKHLELPLSLDHNDVILPVTAQPLWLVHPSQHHPHARFPLCDLTL